MLSKKEMEKSNFSYLTMALRRSHLFGDLEPSTLEALQKEMTLTFVSSREIIYKQGEIPHDMLVVVSGKLQIYYEDEKGVKNVLGKVGVGEIVGEMGVLTGEPRRASVQAIRNSTIAVLSSIAYEKLIQEYPILNKVFTKSIIAHFKKENKPTKNTKKTFAVIAISPGLSLENLIEEIARECRSFGSTFVMGKNFWDKTFDNMDFVRTCSNKGNTEGIYKTFKMQWLNEQEMIHSYIIYVAESSFSKWTELCLKQVDHIVFIANASDTPLVGELESKIENECREIETSLVLVHSSSTQMPSKSKEWLKGRKLSSHYHIREGNKKDYARLARFLTGNAIGLVLGGGGARGLSHLGVIQALREMNIPIDLIGGNSVGALVAALYVMGWSEKDILKYIQKQIKEEGFTLPIVSLFSGKKPYLSGRSVFGNMTIEDLWLKYYSVSCNLSRSSLMVHDKGSLLNGIVASNSAPGLYPPLISQGELFIDGAFLNNVPVDIMRKINETGKIIVVDVSADENLLHNTNHEGPVTGWQVMASWLNPMKKSFQIPNIVAILRRSSIISSLAHCNKMKDLADVYLEPPVKQYKLGDFPQGEKIWQIGYEHTLKAFDSIKGDFSCSN